jgi:SAM-dependent methyltransferase
MLNRSNKCPLRAHLWKRDPLGFYVEPAWVDERFFETEEFAGEVHDPGCGIGRVAEAAYRNGYKVIATDIVNRGYPHFDGCLDFLLLDRPLAENVVCNPPYNLVREFIEHALMLAPGKVAMIMEARRLNAAHWLIPLPLARIHLLTPRPSMPPGRVILAGEKPKGGRQDFIWTVFDRKHRGRPELRWLHRDGVKPEWLRRWS